MDNVYEWNLFDGGRARVAFNSHFDNLITKSGVEGEGV